VSWVSGLACDRPIRRGEEHRQEAEHVHLVNCRPREVGQVVAELGGDEEAAATQQPARRRATRGPHQRYRRKVARPTTEHIAGTVKEGTFRNTKTRGRTASTTAGPTALWNLAGRTSSGSSAAMEPFDPALAPPEGQQQQVTTPSAESARADPDEPLRAQCTLM
jgi:hypothetical protein